MVVKRLVNASLRRLSQTGIGSHLVSPPLYSVAIEPTNGCNLDCVMCYSKGRKEGIMDWQLYKKIIDEGVSMRRDLGVGLNFGGESLLHPKFSDMVEYASSKGVEAVSFNTNGILLTPEVADCFMNHSKGVMTFSVDGLEDSYKKIRKSNYGKVTKNIEFFLQRRNEKELFKPNISVNLVKCGQSDEEIREYINHWVAKVDYVTITERLDENLKIATKDEFISKELEKGRRVCLWPWRYMAVYWDGRIALCCHDLAGKTALKTSLKEKSLAEIWNGEEFKSIRKQHRAMKFPADHLCASCEAWISPYLPSQLSKTEDGTTVWRKGLSTYYTRKPESLGLQS